MDGPIEAAFEKLRRVDEVREEIIRLSRLIGRSSRRLVILVHRGRISEAESMLEEVRGLVRQALATAGDFLWLLYGILRTPIQEYVEGAVFLSIAQGKRIPSYEELSVDPSTYLLGIADSVGEARRLVLNLLKEWEIERAESILSVMEGLVEALSLWDLPDALSPGLRSKVDVLRRLVDSTKVSLIEHARAKRLIEALKDL